jgi:ribonuclease T
LAIPEDEALRKIYAAVRKAIAEHGCSRAILVGHNPAFDLAFLKAASHRVKIKNGPFHAFSTFDTASLSGLVYGQTVLARAAAAAGIPWDGAEAHSAAYDAERTAELFCTMVNRWDQLDRLGQEHGLPSALSVDPVDPSGAGEDTGANGRDGPAPLPLAG